jgi:hypothetical protein
MMAQATANDWQEEAAKVTSVMSLTGLTLVGHGPVGPIENPFETWMALTAEVAHTYARFKDMAWHIVKDILAEPEAATLLETLFQIADRRARRLEYFLTVKYPLVITRTRFDGFELDLIGVDRL